MPALKIASGSEMLFSLKCFIASMLALYVALAAGLPRPFWAMMTAYIVASPFSGAVRSKALFRVCGTLIGCAATIVMVPRMANAPELLSLALACWVGLCLYVSLLDRTPRSYIFMLAGYTAGLIGFPAVSDPSTIFDTGLARVEEITIGILSATVVHSLVFPQGVGPVLLGRLDRAIADAQRWVADTLKPTGKAQLTPQATPQSMQTRLALAGEISDLRVMSTHLPFDTSQLRWTSSMVHGLHDRLTIMVPLLLAVEDRLQTLREVDPGSLTPRWNQLLDDISSWVRAGHDADPARAALLRAELAQLKPTLAPNASWSEILRLNLTQRLDALIEACEDGLELRGNVNAAMQGGAAPYTPHLTPSVLHRDHGMALRSALAAVAAILVCCAFWIGTAWPSGAAAPMMAGVFCCFFCDAGRPGPGDQDVPEMDIAVDAGGGAVHPVRAAGGAQLRDAGAGDARRCSCWPACSCRAPSTGGQAMAFLIGMAGTLSLQDTGTLDIPNFLNSMLAQLFGYIAAARHHRLAAFASAAGWTARRLLRPAGASWRAGAAANRATSLVEFSARMVDRIGLLTPRLAVAHPTRSATLQAIEALRELRIGLNMTSCCRACAATGTGRDVAMRP
jgi:hypothetical protein